MAGKFAVRWIAVICFALAVVYIFLRNQHGYGLPFAGGPQTNNIDDAAAGGLKLGSIPPPPPEPPDAVPSLYTLDPEPNDAESSSAASTATSKPTKDRTLVIARVKGEEVHWVEEHLSDVSNLRKCTYVVDDPSAPYTVPVNKGHEVMPYLTYIINHYDNLTEVNIFMHAHRVTWHNNDLLGSDSAHMIRYLRSEYVLKGGYVSMRCHQDPGCPDHLHPAATEVDIERQEEVEMARAWVEIFPGTEVPKVLSSPCCSQFALSRDKIRSIPLSQYHFYRDWLMKTPYQDFIAGRIWEYLWQYIFLGVEEYCPSEFKCYCEGYAVCFESERQFKFYFDLRKEFRTLGPEYDDLITKERESPGGGWLETGRAKEVLSRFPDIRDKLNHMLDAAYERGRTRFGNE